MATPSLFLSGEFQGQRSLLGYSQWGRKELDISEQLTLSFLHFQFSHSVVSDSFRPNESQHARPPCPSPLPEFTQTHVHQVGDAIQRSHPLSSPSPPVPNPSQDQSLFQ